MNPYNTIYLHDLHMGSFYLRPYDLTLIIINSYLQFLHNLVIIDMFCYDGRMKAAT